MSGLFIKTTKGMAVIEKSEGELPMRVRRILIMVDGNRTVEEIRELTMSADLDMALQLLEEEGYIERAQAAAVDGTQATSAKITSANFKFRELPPSPKAKDLDMARHFIINTLKTFCGPVAHLTIVKAATAATSHTELRELFSPWYEAIVATSAGARRSEELSEMLLKVI
ncbi:MAG: hypothetical protein PHI29_12555 [Gallionella sp.]|nr:hypothetical protein [Gallionella sp.]